MRFPLENNNNGIVKKLAARSLQSDRRRNLFVILTISLSVCLMSTMAFYFSSSQKRTLNRIRGQYQAGVSAISREKAEELAATGLLEQWGLESSIDYVKYKDSTLSPFFVDSQLLALERWAPVTGSYPKAADEVILERAFLDRYFPDDSIGDRILLNLDGTEKEYTVTGILETENTSRVYFVLVSDAFLTASNPGTDDLYTLKFRLKDSAGLEPDVLKSDINAFLDRMGIEEEKSFFSSNYFDLTDLYLGTDGSVYAVAFFIAVACAIVIYNIFYISVMGKMREYGRLKVIGATARQLRNIVKKERRKLSLISIPIGLCTGGLLIAILMPGCWDWNANLRYAVVIVLITEAVLLASTRKPIALAGKVSAIEAVRATAYTLSSSKTEKPTYGRLSLFRLAVMNFSRSQKKAALTLASLSFTGILLMCIAAYGNSIDSVELAKAHLGERADYLIGWSLNGSYTDYADIQLHNPLTPELVSQLKQLPEVTDIRAYSICPVKIQEFMTDDIINITGLTKEQFDRLITPEILLEGEIDYEKLLTGDYILVEETSDHLTKMFYGVQLHPGDKVTVKAENGISREMTVMGVVNSIQTGSGGLFFILPEEVFPLLYPETKNFTSALNLYVTEDSQALREALFERIPDSRVDIFSVWDMAESMKPSLKTMMTGIYGLLAFIFLFALLNLVNTLITNLISRQQEFGILQSVGMSSRQLSKMLSLECLLYIGGTLLIALGIGTPAGILTCTLFSRVGLFGTLTYRFPLLQILLFAVALLVVQAVFSLASVRFCRKQSLVERIKTMD